MNTSERTRIPKTTTLSKIALLVGVQATLALAGKAIIANRCNYTMSLFAFQRANEKEDLVPFLTN
jgi:hypothetical protein